MTVESTTTTSGSRPGRVGKVSAVVINYQGEAYLEACIRSIQALEDPVDEIVVVENASSDGSLNILNTHFRSVVLLRMRENVGASIARNVGLRAAKHRFVLLVDNDVILAPDTLTKLRAVMDAREDLVMLQPRAVYKSDPTRVHYDGGALHYGGLISLRNSGAPLASVQSAGAVDVDVVISLALLVDKKAVVEVGGFDEEMFILFEDLDLCYRLRSGGHGLALVEDAVVQHDSGTPGISFRGGSYPERRVFLHSRNRWIYIAKNYRLWTLLLSAPALCVYEVAWFAFAAKQGNVGAWLRGKRAFFGHARRLWQKRRKVQRMRRVGDRRLLVGGPLTLSPGIAGGQGLGARGLDAMLRGWWAIVRWFVV
ncbi:MAG: glycosyltransferase family 2 protein [Planctomycetota bacterium]